MARAKEYTINIPGCLGYILYVILCIIGMVVIAALVKLFIWIVTL